ncbi:MAG: AMP phosphorylase [Candidatus Undinarchaeales archaeon]|jgi:AMP phosphorylase|nr:AMP phosphorylase [Candidatus Undinarchaeales archaeon]
MLKLKSKFLNIGAGRAVVLLNKDDAEELSVHMSDRVILKCGKKSKTAIVDLSEKGVAKGEIGLFNEVKKEISGCKGRVIEVHVAEKPESVQYIKKKLDGAELKQKEMDAIISDVVNDRLSDVELSTFVAASYIRGYSMDETAALTTAIFNMGEGIDFGNKVVDKHCIGGVAGNRTTLLVVPIIASVGLKMPKTSSRSITSPAGTADTMEVLAPVSHSVKKIQKMVKEVGACIVWTGAVNLAPADDKIIRVRHPLSLDPQGMLLASIMAKKKSVGSDFVVIDIPVGKGAKIADINQGKELGHKFIELGKKIGIEVDCLITDGSQPIGIGIGPALEARDILLALQGKGPQDLVGKACDLAGKLLEMVGKAQKGEGKAMAQEILNSGQADRKMREIIKAQGGNSRIKPEDIKIGPEKAVVKSKASGKIKHIDNKLIARIAKTAGAPKDKSAGMDLHVSSGEDVHIGDALFTVYAKSKEKLREAIVLANKLPAVELGGIILEEIE